MSEKRFSLRSSKRPLGNDSVFVAKDPVIYSYGIREEFTRLGKGFEQSFFIVEFGSSA